MMRRRSNRSATWPAERISTKKGANWARPINPRSNTLAGHRVDLPADRHALHLHGQSRKYSRAQIKREMFVPEHAHAGG